MYAGLIRARYILGGLLLGLLVAIGPLSATAHASAPTAGLIADQPALAAGRTATFKGRGFASGEVVTFHVSHVRGTSIASDHRDPASAVADPAGAVVADWLVCATDCAGELLQIEATGQSSGRVGRTILMDLPDPTGSGASAQAAMRRPATTARATPASTASAATFERLKSFGMPGTGTYPRGGLLQGPDGAFYGTATGGGAGGGTVFKLNADGSGFTVLRTFDYNTTGTSPVGGLILGTDGALYGTAAFGGSGSGGTVFKMNTDGSGFTVLQGLNYSANGAGIFGPVVQGSDGALYGTAYYGGSSGYGSVFKLNADGTGFAVIHDFNYSAGANPFCGLIQGTDGALYGTTSQGGSGGVGTVFKLNTDGSGYAVLRNLSTSTGGFPVAGLMQGSDGALYGTAPNYGTGSGGTVFKLNPDGTGFTVLQNLSYFATGVAPQGGLNQGTDGKLYGTAVVGGANGYGTVFTMNTDGSDFVVLESLDYSTSGGYPYSPLEQGTDGALYGTANQGGTNTFGTVFKLNTDGTGFTVIQNLAYPTPDGAYPQAGLVQGTDGALYGTANSGGSSNAGTVFKLNPDGTGFALLQNMDVNTTGGYPNSRMVLGADGALYGTALAGGNGGAGAGTVFRLNTDGTGFTVLQSFDYSTSGASPYGDLVQGTDGALYGTASQGGPSGTGTLFKLNTDGSGFTLLHVFGSGVDGGYPYPGLIQGTDGALYGATYYYGSFGVGTVFKLNTDGTGFTVLHNFDYTHGGFPWTALMQGSDGTLYGTTTSGGSFGFGTVFKLNPDGTGFAVLQDLDLTTTGGYCYAGLVQRTDGALHGMTITGGSGNAGTVFKLNTDGTGFTVLHEFDAGANGGSPYGTLVAGADGNLYGTTTSGGDAGVGTVFRLVMGAANTPPVASITGPASGSVFAVNTAIPFTGSWTDANGGAHTAQWTFDGTPDASFAAGTGTSGAANTSHTFTSAGVYLISLAVTDDFGASGLASQVGGVDAMVVIYDPNAGFVTGGGWINSPAGAYSADPSLTGKANFGFVSKYVKGASVPTGETEFQYKVGNLNFHSTSYQWLVVSGARAQYKGSGTINGAGSYSFILTVIDGQIAGGGGKDKFRMKITGSSGLVYDNLLNAPDSADPTTVIGGGSIVIHTGGGAIMANEAPGVEPGDVAGALPAQYELSRNCPNPFEGSTRIGFALPERSRVSLAVYDLEGRAVRTLAEGEWAAGRHSVTFDRSASDGGRLSAGIYWVRMNAVSLASGQTFRSLRKMVLVQ